MDGQTTELFEREFDKRFPWAEGSDSSSDNFDPDIGPISDEEELDRKMEQIREDMANLLITKNTNLPSNYNSDMDLDSDEPK